jgi:hypothetical protein
MSRTALALALLLACVAAPLGAETFSGSCQAMCF